MREEITYKKKRKYEFPLNKDVNYYSLEKNYIETKKSKMKIEKKAVIINTVY